MGNFGENTFRLILSLYSSLKPSIEDETKIVHNLLLSSMFWDYDSEVDLSLYMRSRMPLSSKKPSERTFQNRRTLSVLFAKSHK